MVNSELMLDVSQAHELKLAFRRAGYTNDDIKKMCEGELLTRLLPVVRELGVVVQTKHIIDLDCEPFVPFGWEVVEHIKGGQFTWDPEKVKLFLTERQKNGRTVPGNILRETLEGKSPFNATMADYLMVHTQLIPTDWKGRLITFFGTIYLDGSGEECVRCLQWRSSRWTSSGYLLSREFNDRLAAAVPAETAAT